MIESEVAVGKAVTLRVRPGDIVVLMYEAVLSRDDTERIQHSFQVFLPDGVTCVVLDGGVSIATVAAS